jgi:putative nucleotidyltransferase with HDIG domain
MTDTDFISFRKIKLFKGSEIHPRKPHAPPPPKEEGPSVRGSFFRNPFIILGFFVTVLSLIIAYLPSRSLSAPGVGEIAGADIIAPSDLTIEDQETTAKRRIAIEGTVLPAYRFDAGSFTETEGRIHEFFNLGRDWLRTLSGARKPEDLQKAVLDKMGIEIDLPHLAALIKAKFPAELEDGLVSVIGKISAQGIILSKNLFIQGELERGFTLTKTDGGERTARTNDVLDIKEAKERFVAEVDGLEIAARSKMLLVSLSDLFLSPNITYDKSETDARKEWARMSVETVFYTIKKGKVIVRKGDEVTAESIKQVHLINIKLKQRPSWFTNFSGTFLLFAILFITLWYYLKSILSSEYALKKFVMMGATLVLSLVVYRLSLFLAGGFSSHADVSYFAVNETYQFAFPFQIGVLLFAFLTSDHLALIYAILNSLMAGYVLGPNYYPLIFSLIGGIAAIYGVKVYQRHRRTSILRAGLFFVAPINVFVIITIHLIKEKLGGLGPLSVEVLMGLVGGALSAALAFILLPIFETVFRFVTSTKLLELTNSDLPVFRQMAIEAPGSYHHSLIVATLAEKAAEEIKADAMLVKAGALYHDVGKVKMPEYFIENRTGNFDLHKDLTPSLSTLVITNHVKEGLEIARKLKLPAQLRDIIEQHHGNSLVRYFYQKAKEKCDPEMNKIGEEEYRYPGPRPRSREAGLVMLADSVEAASRSLKSPAKDSLKRLITEIFNSYLQDGQLDDCDFSLRDLRSAAASFFSILYAVYHPRVEYPGFDFEMKREKKAANARKNNDRNHQQAAHAPAQPEKDPKPD